MYADVLSPVSETTTRLHGPLGKESLDNKEKVKVDYPREIAVDTVAVTTDNSRGDEDHYIRREDIPKFLHPFPKPGTVSRKEWSLSPKKKEGYHRREKAIKYLHPFPKPGTISKKFDLKTDISDLLKPFPKPGMVTRRTADELLPLCRLCLSISTTPANDYSYCYGRACRAHLPQALQAHCALGRQAFRSSRGW